MDSHILITGATGGIGRNLVKYLAENGINVRAGIHTERKAGRIKFTGVEIVQLNYADISSIDLSLQGIKTLFLLTPIAREQVEYARRMIDRALLFGVEHIINISIISSETEPGTQITRWHRRIERYLERMGVAFTIIKPNMYMQNFLTYMQPYGGIIFLPLNGSTVSYIDVRDIARVCAAVILEGKLHYGKYYELTGRSALSIDNVADILSNITRQHIGYIPLQEQTALHVMESLGFPDWMANGMIELYAQQRSGLNSRVSPAFERLTGKKQISFEKFASDHLEFFKNIINREHHIYFT